MTDLLDLVDRATSDVPWDPDRLVAAATRTGRARLRRRRAGVTVVACAVLGVAGTGLSLAAGGGGDPTRGVDPATHRPTSSASPTPSPAPPDTTRWRLAVTSVQVPATFAGILPGTITTLPQKETVDSAPVVDFRWDGYAVRVALTPDDHFSGTRVRDPRVRCQESSSGRPCVPGQVPGSFESSMTWTGPAVDGGVTTRLVTVSFAQGWDVLVMESNAADTKDSATLAPDVPLTLDQLRQVAYSQAWFTGRS